MLETKTFDVQLELKKVREVTNTVKAKLQERHKFDKMTSEIDKKTALATHRAAKEALKLSQKSLFFLRL